jgi:poly(hydroxyalkanoate) depolymerase family esterase
VNSLPYRDILTALKFLRSGDLLHAAAVIRRSRRGGARVAGGANSSVEREDKPSRLPLPQQDRKRSEFLQLVFQSAAGRRAYKLYIPSTYRGEAACPLIIMLHGCTQSPDDFAAGTRMNAIAEERTFLVAYPEQPTSANSLKCWNWFSRRHQRRDQGEPALVAGITRSIMDGYSIDPERVYVAGMSAGAAAAAVLATSYPDLYAALGVHSGLACGLAHDLPSALAAMRGGNGDNSVDRAATKRQPIPSIVFHGDRDATVHPRNGDVFAADLATMASNKRVERGRSPGGRWYTQTTYTDASGRCLFEQWAIHGAGHAWSGGSVSGSYTDPSGPDASREIVRFFLDHRLLS